MTEAEALADPHSEAALPDPSAEPTVSVERAGQVIGISRGSAYQGVNRGEIPSVRVGHRVRVPTAALLRFLGVEPETVRRD